VTDTPASPNERTVVVAEDESLIRLDVIETLRDHGFNVIGEAADGEKAVELVRELRPDLVVMDVKMPLMDGISAAEIINNESLSAATSNSPH
jgi:YesN/AraC family two-component response regulator